MAEYTFGTHAKALDQAEAVKSKVWGPALNKAGLLACTFVVVGQQSYVDVQPVISRSVRVGAVKQAAPRVSAAPQFIDLTIQPIFDAPTPAPQGRVRLSIIARQQDDTTQIPAVIRASSAPPAGAPAGSSYTFGSHAAVLYNAEAVKSQIRPSVRPPPVLAQSVRSYSVPPQTVDLTLQSFFDAPPQMNQGRLGSNYAVPPQLVDLTLQAQLDGTPPPIQNVVGAPQYTFGSHAAVLYNAEAVKSQVWKSAVTPPIPPKPVSVYYMAAPQLDARQLQPQIYPSTVAALVSGRLARYYSVPPQLVDLSLQSQLDGTPPPIQGIPAASQQIFGTHATALYNAEAVKSRVWASAQGGAVSIPKTLGTYYTVPQQAYSTPQPSIFQSSALPGGWMSVFVTAGPDPSEFRNLTARVSPAASTPPTFGVLGSYVSAPPQLVDYTLQARIQAKASGGVPPTRSQTFIRVSQQTYTDVAPVVWGPAIASGWLTTFITAGPDPTEFVAQFRLPSVSSPLVGPPIIPGPVAPYFKTYPQFEERPTVAIWPAQKVGSKPGVQPQGQSAPQLVDLTIKARIEAPWKSPQGRVPPGIWAGHQTRDLTPPSQVFAPLFTQPIIFTGPTIRQHMFVPAQADPSPNQTQVWSSVGSFVYTIDNTNGKTISTAYGSLILYSDGNSNFYTLG